MNRRVWRASWEWDSVLLCYLGSGQRDYSAVPVPGHKRPFWEFQAVVSGQIAPTGSGSAQDLSCHTLWVFPPQHFHGWRGEPGSPAEVWVFHFTDAPGPLARTILDQGPLKVPLSQSDCNQIGELARSVRPDVARPNALSALRFDRALLDLALMALERSGAQLDAQAGSREHQVVQTAIAWYLDNMSTGVGVRELCQSISYSASHLRRMFHGSLGRSPVEVLRHHQFERVCDLLDTTELTVSEIADRCGYSSPNTLSRAFNARFSQSPRQWRADRAFRRRGDGQFPGQPRPE